VAALSRALTVFARSNSGIVGSNHTRGMDVCVRLFCVCVDLCEGSGLATVWSLVRGVLPTVYRTTNLERPEPTKGCRAIGDWMNNRKQITSTSPVLWKTRNETFRRQEYIFTFLSFESKTAIHSERTLVHKQPQDPWRSTNEHSARWNKKVYYQILEKIKTPR
jgi:hypothetical protein